MSAFRSVLAAIVVVAVGLVGVRAVVVPLVHGLLRPPRGRVAGRRAGRILVKERH